MPTTNAARLATLRVVSVIYEDALAQIETAIAQFNAAADTIADAMMQAQMEAVTMTHPHGPGSKSARH
ncbi:hypothetical protein [Paracoccus beibuensis]|uniref:hypothetical protein n=1 Tax=Paracoccus beibuensis TaxID=547602 RepID=UPI00223EB4FD|nr:hypothetical protein [Paracoccus beibuensis]